MTIEEIKTEINFHNEELKKLYQKLDVSEIIKNAVNNYYNVDISVKTRKKTYVIARHIYMYICSKYTNKTLREIGESAGVFDHSTVIHAKNKITDLLTLSHEKELKKDVEYFISLLK